MSEPDQGSPNRGGVATTSVVAAPASHPSKPSTASRGVRSDIQGLRALAVAAVVIYHLWPAALPGGYVGVDVFLVISGFLITSHLLREPPVSLAGVLRFWGRRVRRLLPASALVVVVTTLASGLLLPSSLLRRSAFEAISSSLYVQNRSLAASASDYLAATAEATPFRHYWSLSVEEQFYLVWPLIIGGAVVVGWWAWRRRVGRGGSARTAGDGAGAQARRRAATWSVAGAVGLVIVGSLAWSVHLTATDPAAAYYATSTRMWELALGGAIAVVGTRLRAGPHLRSALAWAGLGAVALAAVTYDATTPFPGAWALLPVGGTALVIAAAATPGSGPGRLLGVRPAQFLGDVSYSIYLWHWPLVVLAPYALGPLEWWHLVGLAVVSVLLAALTKTWVEDPVRRSRWLARSPWRTVGLLALCTGVGVASGLVLGAAATHRTSAERTSVAAAVAENPECFGAAAAEPGTSCDPVGDHLWTSPGFAAQDKPQVYQDGCWNERPYDTRRTCTYGPAEAGTRVALLGNSHAGQWFPALDEVATDRGWQVTTYLTSVCYPVDIPLAFLDPKDAEGCSGWTDWALAQVESGGYDLVVMSARTDQPLSNVARADQETEARAAYARVLERITAAGAAVLVMRDTPGAGVSVPGCVAVSRTADCTRPRAEAIEVDPLAEAAAADLSGRVTVVDVGDVFCDAEVCHGVVGGVIAYFDHGHMTATFARTLAPRLAVGMDAALADRR